MKNFIRVTKALSDPNRVKIVKMLEARVLCVCEITEALKLAQPTVSRHLKALEDAGLVRREKEGLWVNYSLADGRDNPYAAAFLTAIRGWLAGDPGVAELVSRLSGIRREDICGSGMKLMDAAPAGAATKIERTIP